MLIATFEAMPAERHEWLPFVPGSVATRSPLDLLAECIHTNRGVAAALGQRSEPLDESQRPFESAESAIVQLHASVEQVTAAILQLPDEALERVFETPMMPLRGKVLLSIPALNMQYHNGQLNLLQLLYGDPAPHFPPFD
jgi:hypothetical protein